MPAFVKLPPNLCQDVHLLGKTVYWRDYCSKHNKKKNRLYHSNRKNKDQIRSQSLDDLINEMRGLEIHRRDQIMRNLLPEKLDGTMRKIEDACTPKETIHNKEQNVKGKNARVNSLPGVSTWLQTASESDKQVVHRFVRTVSDECPKPIRRCRSTDDAFNKHVRLLSPPPQSAPLLSREKFRRQSNTVYPRGQSSPSSSSSSSQDLLEHKSVSTQIPLQRKGDKASSPVYQERSESHPTTLTQSATQRRSPNLHHTCMNCFACGNRFDKAPQQSDDCQRLEDHINCTTYFHRVTPRTRRQFIIHPDFVSESNDTPLRRKLDREYFDVMGSHYL